jgi:hypothetical protein
MNLVVNSYSRRVTAGTWKRKHVKTDKERIFALEDHYEQINCRQSKRNSPTNKGSKTKGKDKKNKYDWKKTSPAAGKSHTFVWPDNGKTYHWCPNHKAWAIHSPDECTKNERQW